MRGIYSLIFFMSAYQLFAQENAPISAIDWLSQPGLAPVAEEPVEKESRPTNSQNKITVSKLDILENKTFGLIPVEISNIPTNFWTELDSDTLMQLLINQPRSGLPATDDLLVRALLAETSGNTGVLLSRAESLIDRGATKAAFNLIKQSEIKDEKSFEMFAKVSLLTGNIKQMCGILNGARHLSKNDALKVYCQSESGSSMTAKISYITLQALGAFEPKISNLLAAYLDPDISHDFVPPDFDPLEITPLEFQLYNSINRPIPLKNLPIKFASLDLEDPVSWANQINAAESLVKIGSLPTNLLLQIYNNGQASMPGKLWERVRSVQALHLVLSDPIIDPINELNKFWDIQKDKKLVAALARAWSDKLLEFDATAINSKVLFQMQVLSSSNVFPFEKTMQKLQEQNKPFSPKMFEVIRNTFKKRITTPIEFRAVNILRAMRLISESLDGDLLALEKGINLYRAMGLTPLAQQLTLEYMIMAKNK